MLDRFGVACLFHQPQLKSMKMYLQTFAALVNTAWRLPRFSGAPRIYSWRVRWLFQLNSYCHVIHGVAHPPVYESLCVQRGGFILTSLFDSSDLLYLNNN